MAYTKQVWTDGQNKYNITDQSGNVIESNVKIVNVGVGGSTFSASRMNNIEQGIADASISLRKIRCGGIPR